MNKSFKKYIDRAWALRETKPLDKGYVTKIKKFKGFYCWYPTKEKLKKQGKSVLEMWCELLLEDGKGLPCLIEKTKKDIMKDATRRLVLAVKTHK